MLTMRAPAPRARTLAGIPGRLQGGWRRLKRTQAAPGPAPKNAQQACEYVLVMKPLWDAFRYAGVWPGTVREDGHFHLPLISTRTVLSAALFVFTSWRFYVWLDFRLGLLAALPSDDFARKVLYYQLVVYLFAQFSGLCTTFEMAGLSKLAARWAAFQPKMETACGMSIRNAPLRKSVVIHVWLIGVGWPLFVVVPMSITAADVDMVFNEVCTYAYVTTVLSLTSTHWRMHCIFVQDLAGMLRRAYTETLSREGPSKQNVATFQTLWQELSELHSMHGTTLGLSTGLTMTIYSLSLTQGGYHALYSVLRGFNRFGYFLISATLLCMLTLIRLFNAAHLANEELGAKCIQMVLSTVLDGAPTDALQQLDVFRNVMHTNPARLHLLGFLPINRSSLGALWATMATYLVVLIQFSL